VTIVHILADGTKVKSIDGHVVKGDTNFYEVVEKINNRLVKEAENE
jgi:hypothetical protein